MTDFVAPEAAVQRRATRFALLVVATYAIGFGIIAPVLPQLVMQLGDVSLAEAATIGGGLVAVYGLFQLLLSPVMGALGDRFGRRPVILVALAGFAVDYGIMAFAPNLIWLFVGRAIAGGLGAVFAPAQAVIADVTAPADRARRFGLVGAAFGAGFVIGPGIGGLIAGIDVRAPFFAAAGLAAIAFVVGVLTFRETLPPESRRAFDPRRANPVGGLLTIIRTPALRLTALTILLWLFAVNIYPSLWSYFATERFGWGPQTVGLSLTVVGLSMVAFQSMGIAPLTRWLGSTGSVILGMAVASVIFAAHGINASPIVAFVLCAAVGIQGIVQPSLNARLSAAVDERMQGEVLGISSSLAALAIIAAPLVYNPLLERFARDDAPLYLPGAPFLLASTVGLMALAVLLWQRRAG